MTRFVTKNWVLILVAGLGVMIVGGYNLKILIEALKGIFDPNTEVDNPKDEIGSTISDTEAKILSENLYNAMAGLGTDEETILLTFGKMQNRADYNKVYNMFGKRQYSRAWGNEGDPVTSSRYDLIEWLSYELDSNEQEKLLDANPQLNIFTR